MRILLIMLLAAAVIIAVAGCGEKEPEQTTAVQVQNPPEKPAPEAATPPVPPMPPGPRVTAEKKTVTKDGWTVYESGLKYKDTKAGKGAEAKLGDSVTVHYKGWLDNGKVFDSSRRPGRSEFNFRIGAGGVIRGWEEGVPGMKIGGKRELTIPPELGYGSQDMGQIPPNSTLHFEIELIEVER